MTDQSVIIDESDFENEMNLGKKFQNFSAGFVFNPVNGMVENDDEYEDLVTNYIKFLTFTFTQPIEDKFIAKFGEKPYLQPNKMMQNF